MRTLLHLKPGQKATKPLLTQYGDRLVCVRVGFAEVELREQVKQAGGKWNRSRKVWEMRYDQVVALKQVEPQKWYNKPQYPISGQCSMNFPALSQIEEHIAQLSLDEQLWLIARVAQRLRAQLVAQSPLDAQLAAMAADPEIQNELRAIAEEFASAEADGLAPE